MLPRLAFRGLEKPLFAPSSLARPRREHSLSLTNSTSSIKGTQAPRNGGAERIGTATTTPFSSPSTSSSTSSSSSLSSSSLLVTRASSADQDAHSLPAYVHPPLSPEAIATHPHKPHTFDKKAPPGMKNAHLLVLFSLYASASTSLAAFVLPSTAAAASLLGTVWLSFVLAISFTEAWVKFKAPTLSKAAAVDAGRHVFAALNAVESGLAVALAAALFLATPRPLLLLAPSPASPLDSWRRLAAVPLLALAFQVSWLTPQLDRRARELIVSSWRRKKEKKKEGVKEERENRGDGDEQKARAAVLEMELRDKGTPVPPAWLHAIYVALEAVKVVSLALLVKSAGRGAFV